MRLLKANDTMIVKIYKTSNTKQCGLSSVAGELGPNGATARVIYGQTDSIFVHMPDCSPAEAVAIGQQVVRWPSN